MACLGNDDRDLLTEYGNSRPHKEIRHASDLGGETSGTELVEVGVKVFHAILYPLRTLRGGVSHEYQTRRTL